MHCSSFEPLLDPFVDDALEGSERFAVEAHVADCASCSELLAEIRVIDALLVTPAAAELPPNFTFKVMAEVRSQPRPHVTRTPVLRVLGAYLGFAWIAIATFVALGGAPARHAVSLLEGSFGDAGDVFGALSAAMSRLCDHDALGVGLTMSGILVLDALAALAAVAAYGAVLNRRAGSRATESCES